jgi:hypothetical protein
MSEQAVSTGGELRTRVSRKWTFKMLAIAVVMVGFGLWGLYDATVAYPNRGSRAAEKYELEYLESFRQNRPPLDRRASIDDPKAELDRLRRNPPRDPTDQAALLWLESLMLIGRLDGPTGTAIPRHDFRGVEVSDAGTRLEDLRRKYGTVGGSAINPLTKWDIPVQWLIAVSGLGIGLWLVVLLVRVHGQSYRFDPATMRLTLPDGESFMPSDVEDFDKRKWHKFYVTVRIRKEHPNLGGDAIELDLLRYEPLEEWVLMMERAAFPDRASERKEEEKKQNGGMELGGV